MSLAPLLRTLQDVTPEATPAPIDTPPERLFAIWEICRYLIPIAPEHLRRTLRQNPELPQGLGAGSAKWFPLRSVMALRRFFAKTGRGGKTYLPFRPEDAPAQTITCTGSSAQAGQTTTALHLATRAALEGYRVLALDLTPSGALTAALRAPEAPSEAPTGSLSDLMARHFAQHLQAQNRARLARGAEPLAVDAALAAPLAMDTAALIRPTGWHRLDVLPGGAGLWDLNLKQAQWARQAPDWAPWQALRARLGEDGVLRRYDFIVVDAPPLLDGLALGALHLADHVIVAMRLGQEGTALSHLRRIARAFGEVEEQMNTAARALGNPPVALGQARAQLLVTRHAPAQDQRAVDGLRAGLGDLLLSPTLPEEGALAHPGGLLSLDPRSLPREAYVTARAPLEALWGEVNRQIAQGWRERAYGETQIT